MNELKTMIDELIEATWLAADDDTEPVITHSQEEKVIALLENAKAILK